MKKIFIVILLSNMFVAVNAQTEKGDWLVGGRVDLNTGDNSTHIGFSPNGGYFVIRNVAVGGNLMIDYQKAGSVKSTDFGIGPFVRCYFTSAKARPLLQASFNFLSQNTKAPGFSATNTGINVFLGGGVAVFINENVSIEILTGYSHSKYKGFDGSNGFNIGIGFQTYLSRRQVERLQGN